MPVETYISLSQLSSQIKAVLTNSFFNKTFWVLADVVDHKFYAQKGYHYFCLVEKDKQSHSVISKIQTVAWGAGASSIDSFERITGQKLRNDINVLVNVSVSYHPTYGLQLILNDIDTTFTIGQLELQRQQTLQRLLAECSEFIQKVGDRFVTSNSKLCLNIVLQKIAVVSSKSAAGYKDFIDTIETNKQGYKIAIDPYFTMVQGEGNVDALYQRLLDVFHSKIEYDAVVIIRGGGSQLDFLIFDQFKMAKIVAKFPIPIISGIGHHMNETIVDLMAHTSVKTPSIAAEFIIAHNKSFEEEILNMQKAIIIKSQQLLRYRQQSLSQVVADLSNSTRDILLSNREGLNNAYQLTINKSQSIIFDGRASLNELSGRILSRPRILVANKLNDLHNLLQNLTSYSKRYIINQRGYIGYYASVCKMMSPDNLLRKGFAILYLNNEIVVDAKGIKPSDKIKIKLSNADILATVTSNKETNGTEFNL